MPCLKRAWNYTHVLQATCSEVTGKSPSNLNWRYLLQMTSLHITQRKTNLKNAVRGYLLTCFGSVHAWWCFCNELMDLEADDVPLFAVTKGLQEGSAAGSLSKQECWPTLDQVVCAFVWLDLENLRARWSCRVSRKPVSMLYLPSTEGYFLHIHSELWSYDFWLLIFFFKLVLWAFPVSPSLPALTLACVNVLWMSIK